MKLLDRYKISLHNIKNNKSRSILTTVIVYIISLLIMAILCIAISFSSNMTSVIKEYYEKADEPISINYNLYGKSPDGKIFDKSIYDSVSNIVSNHSEIVSYARYSNSYGDNDIIIDYRFGLNEFYEIIEGSNVTGQDVNKNNVLVSASFANDYYIANGVKLNPGDTIQYTFTYEIPEEEYRTFSKNKELELKVKGIFKSKDVEQESYQPILSANSKIIMDIGYLFNEIQDMNVNSASYYYNTTKTNFNDDELKDKLDSFVTELKSTLPKSEYGSSVYCNALEDLKMSSIIGLVIIGLATFLCLVLILLSIGSLANTIMISVDKNKKFIGLLKALGLNEKDLKSTIKLESITTIVLGIVLSFLTIILLSNVLTDLNALIINSLFANYVKSVNYQAVFAFPIYVPIIVFVFFVVFTLLFARGSMSKIAKTDPMAVISEVA